MGQHHLRGHSVRVGRVSQDLLVRAASPVRQVLASFGLSGFNVFALYALAREIPKQRRTTVKIATTEESPATIDWRALSSPPGTKQPDANLTAPPEFGVAFALC